LYTINKEAPRQTEASFYSDISNERATPLREHQQRPERGAASDETEHFLSEPLKKTK
jgi:hypothetical protein